MVMKGEETLDEIWSQFTGDDFSIIVIRLLTALVLSGLIGFERELNNHFAGFRTHILVGVGACSMMILSLFGFTSFLEEYDNIRFDPARIPSYVVSGIGFLGAGTIMVYGGTIRGLTTAATIWAVAGVGLVVGAGMYGLAVVATIIILISLAFLNNFERLFKKGKSSKTIEILVESKMRLTEVVSIIERYNGNIKSIEIQKVDETAQKAVMKVEWRHQINMVDVFEEIANKDHVISVAADDN